MAKVCANCAMESADDAKFCGSCGTAFGAPAETDDIGDATVVRPTTPQAPAPVAAPPPPPPAGAVPPPPAATGARPAIDAAAYANKLLGWDWKGPIRVAGALLSASLLLTLVVGFLARPGSQGRFHWTFSATITYLGGLWAQIFGADFTGHASGSGGAKGFSGSGHASAGFSAMPLTLTVVTFAVGLFVFRRAIAHYASLLGAALFAVRAALLTVIPLLVMTWIVGMNLGDMAGTADETLPPELGNVSAGIGPSSTQTFFMGFLLVFLVLMGATLAYKTLYPGKILQIVRTVLRGPVAGFGWVLVALIPAGWIAFASAYLLRPDREHTGFHTSAANWLHIISGVFGYGGNLGAIALGLGSWGGYGGSWSCSVNGGGVISSAHCPIDVPNNFHKGLSWWADAGHTQSSPGGYSYTEGNHVGVGLWVVAILAPLILAFAAFMVARSARREGLGAVRVSVATWILSQLIAFPIVNSWSNISAHGSASGSAFGSSDSSSAFGGSVSASGSAHSGFAGGATWMVFLYALLFGLMVMAALGAFDADFRTKVRTFVGKIGGPQGAAATPGQYQVGDIVNGHQFNGTAWVPVAAPPPPPISTLPPPPPPPPYNG